MDLDQLMEQWTQVYLEIALENTIIKIQRETEQDRNKQGGSRVIVSYNFRTFIEIRITQWNITEMECENNIDIICYQ